AAPEAWASKTDQDAPRIWVQSRSAMRSLRARLFAATLGALALTLALTIGIGAVLTRREVDRVQVADVSRRADDGALQRRTSVSYKISNSLSGNVRTIIDVR